MASPTESTVRTESLWNRGFGDVRTESRNPGFWSHVAGQADQWAREASVSDFWEAAKVKKNDWRIEFREKSGGQLYSDGKEWDAFQPKQENAIIEKMKREFCKTEGDMSNAFCAEGPPIPKLDDLVRTRIVCRYVDGVEFLAAKFQLLATEHNLAPVHKRQGNERGYFAQHIYFDHEVIFKYAGASSMGRVRCEIQIATQLATTMWHESHGIYEDVRSLHVNDDEDWRWNPGDPRFITYQLGHTLHLADGLLVQIRNNSTKKR